VEKLINTNFEGFLENIRSTLSDEAMALFSPLKQPRSAFDIFVNNAMTPICLKLFQNSTDEVKISEEVPKSSFYKYIPKLIDEGLIIKTENGNYICQTLEKRSSLFTIL